jgi:hypothetical protein
MDDEIIGWYIFKVRTVSGLFSLVMFVTMPGLRINAHVVAPSCGLFLTCVEKNNS